MVLLGFPAILAPELSLGGVGVLWLLSFSSAFAPLYVVWRVLLYFPEGMLELSGGIAKFCPSQSLLFDVT